MLCDQCKKREAVVHITKIENGRRTELHLCAECARKQGSLPDYSNFNIIDNDFFRKMAYPDYSGQAEEEPRCSSCGMTYSEFNRLGKFDVLIVMKHSGKKLHRWSGGFMAIPSMWARCRTGEPAFSVRPIRSSACASI